MGHELKRRDFLRAGAATVAGLGTYGLASDSWAASSAESRVRRYSRLGRTELEISDISFGSSRTSDPAIARHALERGVNYFDSAESYQGGGSETALGQALRERRNDVYITSKTKCEADTKRGELMAALEGSLKRLHTDRIEVYFNHAVNDIGRLKNDEWYEFTEQAKKQGKIRYTGMSGHAGQLVACMDYAIDNDLVDVILCAYNFGQDPAFYEQLLSRSDFIAVQTDLPRVLAKARAKDIGIVAMKTLRGAKLNDMKAFEQAGGSTFAQAAFRWTLSGPNVDALVVSMTSPAQVDEYLAASGAPAPARAQRALLERYLTLSSGYCEPGCDRCHAACPSEVAISEVLRTRMYASDYGDLPYARQDYAALATSGADATACAGCSAKPCTAHCPSELEVGALTEAAHQMLG